MLSDSITPRLSAPTARYLFAIHLGFLARSRASSAALRVAWPWERGLLDLCRSDQGWKFEGSRILEKKTKGLPKLRPLCIFKVPQEGFEPPTY